MNLDLSQVEAFVAVADNLHFGRAAAGLHISQQGLSHRIGRLERALGEPLFTRGNGTVELSLAGRRFLPRARELLGTARLAVDEVRAVHRPLRVDVWGQVHPPLRWLRRLNSPAVRFDLEISMRRSTLSAVEALARGEIDLAFGRVSDLGRLPDGLAVRPMCREPHAVLMAASHPLAGEPTVRPADLAPYGLFHPAGGTAAEVIGFARHFARDFGVPLDESGPNLSLDELITDLEQRTDRATLLPATLGLPPGGAVRFVTVTDPVPLYTHSMIWRRDDREETLSDLRRAMLELATTGGWLDWNPTRHWLPTPDR